MCPSSENASFKIVVAEKQREKKGKRKEYSHVQNFTIFLEHGKAICKSVSKKIIGVANNKGESGRWQERSLIKPINWGTSRKRSHEYLRGWKTVLKYCIAYTAHVTRHNNEVSGKWSISPIPYLSPIPLALPRAIIIIVESTSCTTQSRVQ